MSDEKKLSDFFVNFETRGDPTRERALMAVKTWARAALDKKPCGLVLWSNGYGAGKTMLARCAYDVLNYTYASGQFITAPDFMDLIKGSYEDGSKVSEAQLFREWRKQQFIIIDDFGKQYTRQEAQGWEFEKWFKLIDVMQERALLMTSNLNPQKIGERIGGAASSRLTGMCEFVDMSALPDFRLVKRKENVK
jgi:DNA replication protein DnaC